MEHYFECLESIYEYRAKRKRATHLPILYSPSCLVERPIQPLGRDSLVTLEFNFLVCVQISLEGATSKMGRLNVRLRGRLGLNLSVVLLIFVFMLHVYENIVRENVLLSSCIFKALSYVTFTVIGLLVAILKQVLFCQHIIFIHPSILFRYP